MRQQEMVVVYCQDSWLEAQGDPRVIQSQIQAGIKDVFPGVSDPVAHLQSITHRVVSAPYSLTLEIAQMFLPTAKELLIDPSASGLSPPLPESTIAQWLSSSPYSAKRIQYYERGSLCYTFNAPSNKVTVAVLPASFYQAALAKGGSRPVHVACAVGEKRSGVEITGKIYIDLKGRRPKARYWEEERTARLVVGVIRGLKPLMHPVSESPDPDSFSNELLSKCSQALSRLTPPAHPAAPLAAPDISAAPLDSEMKQYSDGVKRLLAEIAKVTEMVGGH